MTLRFCHCGAVTEGRCQKCGPRKNKLTTKQNGYGSDWKLMSERFRAQNPLCHDCLKEERVAPSTECHHIVKISDDRFRRLDPNNIVALCRKCHMKRHEEEKNNAR